MVRLSSNDFGARVMRAATAGAEERVAAFPSSHTKVGDLDVLVAVEEQVFRLEVTVSDVETMAVIDGVDNLLEVVDGLGNGETTAGNEVVEQFAALKVLHDEVPEQLVSLRTQTRWG